MNSELVKHLRENYPEIYQNIREIACDDGWFTLIDTLSRTLYGRYKSFKDLGWDDQANEAKGQLCVASQIKEKFGGLRFYVNRTNDFQYGAISLAENLSYKICEKCGTTENVQCWPLEWHRTLCKTHAEQQYGVDKVNQYEKENRI